MESSIFAEEVMTGMTLPAIECWSTENTLQESLNVSWQNDSSRDRHAESSTAGDNGRGFSWMG
jgi:hypothetical protein